MRYLASSMVGLAGLFAASQAMACACCAEPGQRNLVSEPFGGYATEELLSLQFADRATTFMTACDQDCVEGISVFSDGYKTKVAWSDDGSLRLDLRAETDEASGTLTISRPKEMTLFSTDPTPGSSSGMVSLYTEWRIQAPVTGTGTFKAVDPAKTTATLIIHGTGNSCVSTVGMTNWTLDVKGEGVDFRLFGKLNEL